MNNIINVNSANIIAFGFQATFDLELKKVTLDISQYTTFQSGGALNVLGVFFDIVAPGGFKIATIDLSNPAILPSSGILTIDIPLPGNYAMFGFYQIKGVIQDADSKQYSPSVIIKEVSMPEGWANGLVPGAMSMDVNCNVPELTIRENTVFAYRGLRPSTTVKAGILSYPRGTLADLDFTFTPIVIGGSGNVYTGRYTINNKTICIYDLKDGVLVSISYAVTSFEKVVSCNSPLSEVMCCIDEVKTQYDNAPFSATGKLAKEKLDAISIPLYLAIVKTNSGADASNEVAEISAILKCNCGKATASLEAQPILSGAQAGQLIIVEGQQAANVTASSVGSNTVFTVLVKDVIVNKSDSDLNFSISRSETETQVIWNVAFDYSALAETMLQTIYTDEGLLALLKLIVGSVSNGVDLSGIANNCVISINDCNYLLVEDNNIPKTITSATINGDVYTAPDSLLLSNVGGVATWLNSLGLGTFTADLDSGANTVSIVSNANPNIITAFILAAGSVVINRRFSRNCQDLTDVLNAITTYICALNSLQIVFGVNGQLLATYTNTFNVNKIPILPATTVGSLLTSLLTSMAALYDRLDAVGLTCPNIQQLFQPVDLTLVDSDGVLGTVGGKCAFITNDELAANILNRMVNNVNLQSILCGLTANCAGAVCAPVTNVSAVFGSGNLVVNCNDNGGGTTPIKIRYRINNSGLTFTEVDVTAADLPKTIGGGVLVVGQYEVQVAKTCTNGVTSPWSAAVSNNTCKAPTGFSVVQTGTNFVVTVALTNPQTKVEVQMTDPNGAITTVDHDFSPSFGGSLNIPVPAGIYGNYTFKAKAICDDTVVPVFASIYTANSIVNVANPVANNIRAVANYGLEFTDIRNGTASGIPTSFNSNVITGNFSDYTPSVSNGTILATVAGAIPGTPVFVRLVKNGSTILDSQSYSSGPGVYALNNTGGVIVAPDTISIEIDS